MNMELKENENYLYFPKANLAEGKIKANALDVGALCTKDYLFIIPDRQINTFVVATRIKTYYADGKKPTEMVAEMIKEPGLTVAELEERMIEWFGEKEREKRVFKIDELDVFKNTTGLFGQTRFKKKGKDLKVLALKGKGVKKVFKEFYEN